MLSVASSLAQPYPNKQVRVVVGFAAGGPSDVIGRIVAQKLSETLGQQFYVENVGGAGGNTAAAQVARAAPDGYTIHIVSTGFMVNMSLYAKVPYDAVKEFAPVTLVAYSPNVVAVNPSVPAKTSRSWCSSSATIPANIRSPDPASARRRILRASSSASRSIST